MQAFLQLEDAQRYNFEYQVKALEHIIRQKDEQMTKLRLDIDIKDRTITTLVKQVVELKDELQQLQGVSTETEATLPSSEGPERKRVRRSSERAECWQSMYDRYTNLKIGENMSAKSIKQLHPDLHEWITEQRAVLNGKTSTQLTQEQQKLLKCIGLRRDYRSGAGKAHIPWSVRFEELKDYAEKHGHTRVTQRDDAALSNWVSTLRKAYKKNGEHELPLTPARFKKLQELRFEWEVKASGNSETWEQRFNELLQYKSEHGNAYVPRSSNSKLNAWCRNQRKKMKDISEGKPRGLLTEERVARLDAIGFPWEMGISAFGSLLV